MNQKNLLIIVLLLSGYFASFAQYPTLTKFNNPAVGDINRYINVDSTNINPGTAGANQTWDFSNLVLHSKVSSESWVAPSTTTYSILFSASSVSFKDVGEVWVFYTASDSTLVLDGKGTSYTGGVNYSDNQIIYRYPFTYGNKVSDKLSTKYKVSVPSSTNMKRYGTSYTEADGYGTLKLPAGITINNALRVKHTATVVDTVEGFSPFAALLYNVMTQTTYYWFDNINKVPVFKINIYTNVPNSAGYFPSGTWVYMLDALVSAKNISNNSNIQIYPNPAKDVLNITAEKNSTVDIYSVSGQLIKSMKLEVMNNQINISGFNAGVYTVKVSNDKEVIHSKFIKE